MKKTLILSCVLALAGLTQNATAAEAGSGYVRAEIGRSEIDLDLPGAGSQSEDDTAIIFAGGYWFTPKVAVEAHIGSLYNQHRDGEDTDVDLVTLGLGLAAKHNFGPDGTGFFLGGRAGIARLTAQVREDTFDVIEKEHSTKPYVGLSAGYDFSQRFGLSLNWDLRQGDFDGVDIDVHSLTLGGEFRF